MVYTPIRNPLEYTRTKKRTVDGRGTILSRTLSGDQCPLPTLNGSGLDDVGWSLDVTLRLGVSVWVS